MIHVQLLCIPINVSLPARYLICIMQLVNTEVAGFSLVEIEFSDI